MALNLQTHGVLRGAYALDPASSRAIFRGSFAMTKRSMGNSWRRCFAFISRKPERCEK